MLRVLISSFHFCYNPSLKNWHSESWHVEKYINVSVQCKPTQSLQVSSQLFYYLAVNIWLAYFGSAIPLSFIMPCDYIFIAYCICLILLLSALHPLTFFLSPCSSSFLHHHSPYDIPLSYTPTPRLRLSLCWGGCTCCDFDKVVSAHLVLYFPCECEDSAVQKRAFVQNLLAAASLENFVRISCSHICSNCTVFCFFFQIYTLPHPSDHLKG